MPVIERSEVVEGVVRKCPSTVKEDSVFPRVNLPPPAYVDRFDLSGNDQLLPSKLRCCLVPKYLYCPCIASFVALVVAL